MKTPKQFKIFQLYKCKPLHFVTCCILALFAFSESKGADPSKKPNIIVILSDDVGIGDITCYGSTMTNTPNVDKLAAQGMLFNQAYSAGAVCSPSRYGLLTGKYPSRGPIKGKAQQLKKSKRFSGNALKITPEIITLPQFLKQQGYKSACIGKWHLGYGEQGGVQDWSGGVKPGPLEIGFDYHLGIISNHSDQWKTYVENHKLLWLKEGVKLGRKDKPTLDQLTDYRRDDEVDTTLTSKACEFIRENKEGPFFVYLALVAAHTHVTPAEQFRGTSKAGQYGDYIHELDHHVGTVTKLLDELDLSENTLLIFTSDNGGQSGDASYAGVDLRVRSEAKDVVKKAKTAKADAYKLGHRPSLHLKGHKASINEGGSRVPFIARWPGKIEAGSTTSAVLSLTDLLATSAGILGTELPAGAGGDSFDLSPVLFGKPVKTPIRTTTILQSSSGCLALRQDDWKLILKTQPVWDGNKAQLSTQKAELINLAEDPGEANNLAKKHPERLETMFKLLQALLEAGKTHGVPTS